MNEVFSPHAWSLFVTWHVIDLCYSHTIETFFRQWITGRWAAKFRKSSYLKLLLNFHHRHWKKFKLLYSIQIVVKGYNPCSHDRNQHFSKWIDYGTATFSRWAIYLRLHIYTHNLCTNFHILYDKHACNYKPSIIIIHCAGFACMVTTSNSISLRSYLLLPFSMVCKVCKCHQKFKSHTHLRTIQFDIVTI